MQAQGTEKRVRFLGWDAAKRASEMDLLADISFEEGKIIFQEDENFLIEWDSGERGFHFTTEFEEVKHEPAGKKFWQEIETVEYRVAWLKAKGFTAYKDANGPYFMSPRGKRIEVNQVRQFMYHDVYEKIYAERMELLIRLDADYASNDNRVGFSKYDTEHAHSLWQWKVDKKFWTDQQLKFVVKILYKYRLQVLRLQGEKFIPVTEFTPLGWPEEMNEYTDQS